MRKLISFFLFSIIVSCLFAQQEPLYHPEADARSQINEAIKIAQQQNKHVFIQIGGNWCGWCWRFHGLVNENDTISQIMDEAFTVVHVNYSKENLNKELLREWKYPQRFGFPVFVILDKEGNQIHTQNSIYLEEGKGYSVKRIVDFLEDWSPSALDPTKYK